MTRRGESTLWDEWMRARTWSHGRARESKTKREKKNGIKGK
jgi:hypothetical protein